MPNKPISQVQVVWPHSASKPFTKYVNHL